MCESQICVCGRKYRIWRKMRRRKLKFLVIVICLALVFLILFMHHNIFDSTTTAQDSAHCSPIDVVYTYVNGSDPNFIKLIQQYGGVNYDIARFDDKNELKYSLRSLELYAPWIRHIYVVTNQIPHWLDLSNERITVVPHELISPQNDFLPTFSSSAIETFLHRIPTLSKRFLYLNDDIFLGMTLYPEDLYTDSEGVKIFQAWMVPDCAEECPWTYIGDGACDKHCNIAACQYDGGDCAPSNENTNSVETGGNSEIIDQFNVLKNITMPNIIRRFPLRKKLRRFKTVTSFKEFMGSLNFTNFSELQELVDTFNKQNNKQKKFKKSDDTRITTKSIKSYESPSVNSNKSTKDIYSQSLLYTNKLLNRHYGFKARNVPGHVGFLLDRDIINDMQKKFISEIEITASHRFRAANDLQFAFTYYSFLHHEQDTKSVEDIFDEFDTDNSGTWSDREVRTFMTRMFPIVDWSSMHFFESVINNCSRLLMEDLSNLEQRIYSTLAYERYEDSNLPTITKSLVSKCLPLAEAMIANLATRSKYKHKVIPQRNNHSNFMMLTSNISQVTYEFDKIRRNPRKFNCINDNLDPTQIEDNALIRNLLEDFYISFFPRRSGFELPPQFRNRFTTWHEYQQWRRRKRAALALGYTATISLLFFLLRFLLLHKFRSVRRCVQKVLKT